MRVSAYPTFVWIFQVFVGSSERLVTDMKNEECKYTDTAYKPKTVTRSWMHLEVISDVPKFCSEPGQARTSEHVTGCWGQMPPSTFIT